VRSNNHPQLRQTAVWRKLADAALDGTTSFTQQAIAEELGLSKGLVHHATLPLRASGAIEITGKRLVVRDVRKILLHWATLRRLDRDQIVQLHSTAAAVETVALAPPGLAFTSFAGFVRRYGEQPAPFTLVRAYANPADDALVAELSRRFADPTAGRPANLIIHAADSVMVRAGLGHTVSPAQLYVDLWNEGDFFAVDYLRDLERRLVLA